MSIRHRPSVHDLILHSYVAISYVKNEGAGVGIVQQAHLPEPCAGKVDHRIPNKDYVYGWTQKNLAAQGIETHHNCHLRSLVYALSNLQALYKEGQTCQMPRKVIIHSRSRDVVRMIARHRELRLKRRRKHRYPKDPKALRRILKRIRRLHEMGPEIFIVHTQSTSPAASRAVTLSRRRGRKACANRRKVVEELQASSSKVTNVQNEEENMTSIGDSIDVRGCLV